MKRSKTTANENGKVNIVQLTDVDLQGTGAKESMQRASDEEKQKSKLAMAKKS